MDDRIRIFISSSFADLQLEREYIRLICNRMAWDAREFPEQAAAGSRPKEYLAELLKCHVLVYLITGASDAVAEELGVARDSGMPLVALAKRTETTHGSTVSEVARQYRDQPGAEFVREFSTLGELEQAVVEGVSRVVTSRFLSSLVLKKYSNDLYDEARRLLTTSSLRFALAQETSSLVLGPRRDRRVQERKFNSDLVRYVERIARGENGAFLHVFNAGATLEAIRNERSSYPELSEALAALRKIAKTSAGWRQIQIVGVEKPVTAAIVADSSFQMACVYGERYYTLAHEFGAASNRLWEILSELAEDGSDLATFITRAEHAG